MNVVNFGERSCERYRRFFDAYLDNELLVETNQELLQHLSSCAECAEMLEGRARLKQRVKSAVAADDVPLELANAVRGRLRHEHRSFFAGDSARWMMAAAAVLVLAIVGIAGLRWARTLPAGDSGMIAAVSDRVQEILRVGLVDHVHCAILSKRWQQFVSFEEMEADKSSRGLGEEFIALVPAVQEKLGAAYRIVNGHHCVANGRRYAHLILTAQDGTLLSVIVTEKQNESFSDAHAIALARTSEIPIYGDRQGVLEVAGFESEKYLAYVISNLDHTANLDMAASLAPVVYNHLRNLEQL